MKRSGTALHSTTRYIADIELVYFSLFVSIVHFRCTNLLSRLYIEENATRLVGEAGSFKNEIDYRTITPENNK